MSVKRRAVGALAVVANAYTILFGVLAFLAYAVGESAPGRLLAIAAAVSGAAWMTAWIVETGGE